MATYYQESSELQADGLQTLYLMNPNNYVGLSDNQHQSSPTNMFYFNENNSAAAAVPAVSHALLPLAEQFVGIPISNEYPRHSSALDQEEEIHGSCHNTMFFPRFDHYSLWGDSVDQTTAGNQPKMYQQTSKVLSLSLSPHLERFIDDKSVPGYQDFSGQSSNGMMNISPKNSTSYSSMISAVTNGINSTAQSVIIGSKYLKAAKQLLDEVVSVGKCIDNDGPKGAKYKVKKIKESMTLNVKASSTGGENGGKGGGVELTIPLRQELLMKKAILLCTLEEVEQRNRQYRHQMQIVVESLEQVAGIGSAKSYTNLALNTILNQFKCLKDAISGQVKELNKTLGEEQGLKDGSRIVKVVEHQLRQEKTFQRLGMMQNNNAWRSQRGLPERAVSVLRAWLFENFLHPYPKDSDKQMLAKQTGLTRSQVSNWFINARVRLWKPMVEEMYLEEIKNQEEDQDQDEANSNENCTIKNEPEIELGSKQDKNTEKTDHVSSLIQSKPQNLQVPSPTEISASTVITTSPTTQPSFAQLITSLNMENIPENNPKKPRNRLDTQNNSPNSTSSKLSDEMEMKESRKGFMDNKFISDEQKYFNSSTRYGYEIEELGLRFNNTGQMPTSQIFHRNNNNNNVFLTLALPPSQNSSQSAARNHHQNFLSNPNFEFGTRIESGVSHTSRVNGIQDSNIGYDQILGFQNRKAFPSQLLPDFVV